MPQPSLMKRAIAELIGTWVLVFLGMGSVVTMVVFFKSLKGVDQAALLSSAYGSAWLSWS